MTKRRAVVTGWDPAHVNPDTSTGRPKGVQTAIDMRIATTFDVISDGIFAAHGVPAITGSPTNSATISPFLAAITSPNGGRYIVKIDANENFTINMANVGAVKIYVQQQDYEVDNTKVDSEVVIGAVYGATAIPAGSLLLFTTTITNQTSTSGLTFTRAFKFTTGASGVVRVPTKNDLSSVALIETGARALVTNDGNSSQNGEYFYTGSAWQQTTVANPKLDNFLSAKVNTDGTLKDSAVKYQNLDLTSFVKPKKVTASNVLVAQPGTFVSTTYDFIAGMSYLVLFNVQQRSFNNVGAVWQFDIRVNGVYAASARAEGTGQAPHPIIGLYTAATTANLPVTVVGSRLTGGAAVDLELPTLMIIPILSLPAA